MNESTHHWVTRKGENIVIRPIGPQDAAREQAFIRELSDEARYFRFISASPELSAEALWKFTNIDPDREAAFVALAPQGQSFKQIAVARFVIGPTRDRCEFAIVVADQWQGHGIGTKLMTMLFDAARARGVRLMEGFVLATNTKMLTLAQSLGFDSHPDPDDARMRLVRKPLTA